MTAAVARGTAARGRDGTGAAIWHMLVPRVNLRGAVARRVGPCGGVGHRGCGDGVDAGHADTRRVMMRRVMRMRLLAAPRVA